MISTLALLLLSRKFVSIFQFFLFWRETEAYLTCQAGCGCTPAARVMFCLFCHRCLPIVSCHLLFISFSQRKQSLCLWPPQSSDYDTALRWECGHGIHSHTCSCCLQTQGDWLVFVAATLRRQESKDDLKKYLYNNSEFLKPHSLLNIALYKKKKKSRPMVISPTGSNDNVWDQRQSNAATRGLGSSPVPLCDFS